MRTKEQWLDGIYRMKRNLYMGGEAIGRDDEIIGTQQASCTLRISEFSIDKDDRAHRCLTTYRKIEEPPQPAGRLLCMLSDLPPLALSRSGSKGRCRWSVTGTPSQPGSPSSPENMISMDVLKVQ